MNGKDSPSYKQGKMLCEPAPKGGMSRERKVQNRNPQCLLRDILRWRNSSGLRHHQERGEKPEVARGGGGGEGKEPAGDTLSCPHLQANVSLLCSSRFYKGPPGF